VLIIKLRRQYGGYELMMPDKTSDPTRKTMGSILSF